MKKIMSAFLIILTLFIFSTSDINANEEYYIDDYHIQVVVGEDGGYDIKENLNVVFEVRSRGIYRTLPTTYKNMDFGDGELRHYYFPITKIEVPNRSTYIERTMEGITLRIGDTDKYLLGMENYNLSYHIQTHDLGEGLGQFFYLNLIGNDWDTYSNNFSFEIQFEKDVDYQSLETYIGYYGAIQEGRVSCESNSLMKSVSCQVNGRVNAHESVTVLLPLEDYFLFKNFDNYYYGSLMFSLVILMITVYMFIRFGKDSKLVKPIMFGPPSGVNSAEVGYIFDNKIDNRDIISLFLEWGRKGFIQIIEIKDEKKDDLKIIKLQEIVNVEAYEKKMFDQFFEDKEEVIISDLATKFYKHINECKQGVRNKYKRKENKLFHASSLGLQFLFAVLGATPIPLYLLLTAVLEYYYLNYVTALIVFIFFLAINMIAIVLERYFVRDQAGKTKSLLLVIGVGVIQTFTCIFVSFILSIYRLNLSVFWINLVISFLISMFVIKMDKRTDKGMKLYGEVLGLEEFIRYVEADRLKLLVEEDPYVFYNVLPYAYAFNLTLVWSNHFKNLLIPEVDFYVSNTPNLFNPYVFAMSFNNAMNLVDVSLNSIPAPKGNVGGGFSGGGFGGGGFSGGGFGGGGGGRW